MGAKGEPSTPDGGRVLREQTGRDRDPFDPWGLSAVVVRLPPERDVGSIGIIRVVRGRCLTFGCRPFAYADGSASAVSVEVTRSSLEAGLLSGSARVRGIDVYLWSLGIPMGVPQRVAMQAWLREVGAAPCWRRSAGQRSPVQPTDALYMRSSHFARKEALVPGSRAPTCLVGPPGE